MMIYRGLQIVAAVGLTSALGACSTAQLGPGSNAVAVRDTLPAPDVSTDSTDFSNYRIGPSDQLSVEVMGAPELKREGQVDAAGNLSIPLVGNVVVGGKTPQQVSEIISTKLRGRYLKDPQVTVNIVKANARTVTVDGAVGQPGLYPVTGRMTLQQAVASARGAGEIADLGNVVIFRTVNNQKMAALFSLKEIRAGRMPDPQIYGNDIVVVGESAARRFFKDLPIFQRLGSFMPFL